MTAASQNNPRKRNHISAVSKNIKKIASPATTAGTSVQETSGCAIFARLIDSGIISDEEPVFYRRRRNGSDLKVGKLTRHGILCVCCGKTFVVSQFEAHAASGLHQPNAHLFLGDGRSVMECHLESVNRQQEREIDYDVCEICGDAGQLMLCDGCDCGFHSGCLHMDRVPEGDWYCASCLCAGCGEAIIVGNQKDRVSCAQCRRSFHGSCAHLHRGSQGTWFCQESCRQVFMNLRSLVGKKVQVDEDDGRELSWILLRSFEEEKDLSKPSLPKAKKPKHSSEEEVDIERYLSEALEILKECFNRIVDATTNIEILPQTVFNRKSDVRRVDCSGFYTMVLLKKGQATCVATLRIHGARVAEIPFVATKNEFQQQGMCKALMKALEKMLREKVGVQELLLPSISQMVGTWMGSFGFEHVSAQSHKQIVSQVHMMSFPGTTLLHKTLITEKKKNIVAGQQPRKRPQVGLMRPKRMPTVVLAA